VELVFGFAVGGAQPLDVIGQVLTKGGPRMPAAEEHGRRVLTGSERRWLAVRSYLVDHRYELGLAAAAEYPDLSKAAGGPLLVRPEWVPTEPLPLETLELEFRPEVSIGHCSGIADETVVPVRQDGSRYHGYSAAMAELAAPAVFENRATYRLHEAELTGTRRRLVFGRGRYFDGLDTGEAAAHEYAGTRLGVTEARLRSAIPDPCDFAGRPTNMAISTLTLCVAGPGDASFLLHWRDPAKVGHAGGLYQVLPVGVFQPSDDGTANEVNDFSLWRCMIREYAEELLGEPEDYGSPIDYDAWPLARAMNAALHGGGARAFVLGLGVDPLTFATDLLTVVALPWPLFMELFGELVIQNAEGRLVRHAAGGGRFAGSDGGGRFAGSAGGGRFAGSAGVGVPFNATSVRRFVSTEPMQAAGAALLGLAWRHATELLEL
jgi:hypothetical protein